MKLQYEKKQQVCNIGGRVFGGQPGQNPPLVIGNMFWTGDKTIESRKKLKFDREAGTAQIRRLEELEQITGLPTMVDLVANSFEEMKMYIDFFLETTQESKLPFSTDLYVTKKRIPCAEYVASLDVLDRYVYNSFSFWEKDPSEEIEYIKGLGVKHVLLALWDQDDDFASGRITCLEKLLPLVQPHGFETVLCDTTPIHLATSLIGNKAIEIIKEKYGLPSGCGPNNGVSRWWKDAEVFGGKEAYRIVSAATEAFCSLGVDWLMYGPINSAGRIYPAVAVAQCNVAALVMDEFRKLPENKNHPLFKMFPDVVKGFEDMLAGVKKERSWTVK